MDEMFYAEMMAYFLERVAGFMKQAIRAGADFISMSGNMASGSMAGPRMFAEYVMPYEKRVIGEIHREGAKVIYHNCGDARALLPLYAQMNIDMYESLTAAPYGDTVLEEALRDVPMPTALSGGIDQIDFLKTATPEAVRARVRQVMEAVKPRGRFVLAASDYICEGTPEENLYALAEAGLAFGAY
jgi:uroporphyrinogen-III decarboxylase